MLLKTLKRKNSLRVKRKKRIRGKISGTIEIPRISIFKSNRTIYAQAIEDENCTTLVAIDGSKLKLKANKEGAVTLAKEFSKLLKEKNIQEAVFDRNGYLYHGVVAAFADTLRENGLKI